MPMLLFVAAVISEAKTPADWEDNFEHITPDNITQDSPVIQLGDSMAFINLQTGTLMAVISDAGTGIINSN